MPARGRVLQSFLCAMTLAMASMAAAQDAIPRRDIGGFVSIPGAPLPPVPASSVRDNITIWEPFLAVYRYIGTKRSVARGIGFLATLYASIGDYAKATERFDEAETLLGKAAGDQRDFAWLNNNRGLMQMEQQLYTQALQSYRRALNALPADASLREAHATILQNLATALQFLGDVEGSEDAYLEALDVLRQSGPEHSVSAQMTRANLALLYATIGDDAEARPIYEELAAQKSLTTSMRFAVLNGLAMSLASLKEYGNAEARLNEALALKDNGPTQRATILMNLSSVLYRAGEYERLQPVAEEAARLADEGFGRDSRVAAAASATLGTAAIVRGDLVKADVLLTRAKKGLSSIGGDRDVLVSVLRSLAIVAERRGQHDRALALSREALDLQYELFHRILAFGSEIQRLGYRQYTFPYDLLANLGDGKLLGESVLTMKGAVLESQLRERALARKSTSPDNRERLDRIHVLRVELMDRVARGGSGIEPLQRALKEEETALAKSLSLSAPHPPLENALPRVQNTLARDQALIEIIRFEHLDANCRQVPWYGAVIIGREGSPAWVPLGPAETIDATVQHVVNAFEGARGVHLRGGEDGAVAPYLRDLYERLWKPVTAKLPAETKQVFLSPDGATHFVPWATLLDTNSDFLAEHWQLSLLGSGRDLLRSPAASTNKTVLALADGRGDLPYTRVEVDDLAQRAKANGWSSTVLLGPEASEARLFNVPHPRILHFATHAGELHGSDTRVVERRLGKNPMYRGYLLLGGAQEARDGWSSSSIAPFFDDGILTAEEAGGLDLGGTWLTVLSACNTGAGDATTGEGVFGLRRGFTLAGTENLLYSLWPVQDDATATFMSGFYERLFLTGDVPAAFRETQLAELRRWKKSNGISTAVDRAGGFALTR